MCDDGGELVAVMQLHFLSSVSCSSSRHASASQTHHLELSLHRLWLLFLLHPHPFLPTSLLYMPAGCSSDTTVPYHFSGHGIQAVVVPSKSSGGKKAVLHEHLLQILGRGQLPPRLGPGNYSQRVWN